MPPLLFLGAIFAALAAAHVHGRRQMRSRNADARCGRCGRTFADHGAIAMRDGIICTRCAKRLERTYKGAAVVFILVGIWLAGIVLNDALHGRGIDGFLVQSAAYAAVIFPLIFRNGWRELQPDDEALPADEPG